MLATGESNVMCNVDSTHWGYYSQLFRTLITSWRADLAGNATMPFVFVQLAACTILRSAAHNYST